MPIGENSRTSLLFAIDCAGYGTYDLVARANIFNFPSDSSSLAQGGPLPGTTALDVLGEAECHCRPLFSPSQWMDTLLFCPSKAKRAWTDKLYFEKLSFVSPSYFY